MSEKMLFVRSTETKKIHELDYKDFAILELMFKVFDQWEPNTEQYLIVKHKKIVEDTKIDIGENELFARLQNLVNLNLLTQEIIPIIKENGERQLFLGYKNNKLSNGILKHLTKEN